MNKKFSREIAAAGNKRKAERDYWLEKLSGDLVKSSFQYDYHLADQSKRSQETMQFQLKGELFSRILELSKSSDYRVHIMLTAALNVLIYIYTENRDIIVGTPIYKQDIEGEFINTILPLRNQMQRGMTFKEMLLQVGQTLVEAEKNQNYPIETLFHQLNIQSPGNEFSLFDIIILLQNIHDKKYIQNIKPNIIFSFLRREDYIEGELEYNALFYKKSTLEPIINHYKDILKSTVFNVDLPISCLAILSGEEKKRLLFEFNDTRVEYSCHQLIQLLFEEQVEKTPDKIAVIAHSAEGPHSRTRGFLLHAVTYREVNRKVNQMARLLRENGVKPDAIAAIIEGRTIDMVINIFAVLKAGGAYLPIDPNLPLNRILYILEDCKPAVILTRNEVIKKHSIPFTVLKNLKLQEAELCVTSPRTPINDLDRLPIPDRSLIEYEKYSKNISLAMVKDCISIQGTRGCPYDCSYCAKLWPKKHVFRSAENLLEEVRLYYDMGIKRFAFIDDIFNLNRKNSERFFELIIKNDLKIQILFPAGLRGDIMTKDYIDLMVEAGTINISVALETASPRLQKLIKKNLDIEKIEEILRYICEKYPQVILDLFTMHGLPTETREEAMMTLEFLKNLKWIHFPLINILKIYPNTDMEKLALESGISRESILKSENLPWHEFSETLPFDKNFTLKYQTDFLNEYFLLKERLLNVLPHQMKALNENEIVQKYNSYLPTDIGDFADLLEFIGIDKNELAVQECLDDDCFSVPGLDQRIKAQFAVTRPHCDSFRVLLLDLSQSFSNETRQLDELFEAPLGLMYLLTYLKRELGSKIHGKIAKSCIDFDNYIELKAILDEFKPGLIGIRTLTFYRDFFHKTVSLIKQWGYDIPVIVGGPYATSSYSAMLQDRNVDLAVLAEGEITFTELVNKIIENNGRMPGKETLEKIPGIVFNPGEKVQDNPQSHAVILSDLIDDVLEKKTDDNPVHINQPGNAAYTIYTSGSSGNPKGVIVNHQNVINLVYGLEERLYNQYDEGLRIALLAPYVFDASVKQLFAALLQGHTLTMVPEEVCLDGFSLFEYYRKHKIGISDGTPTHIRILLESMIETPSRSHLKHFIIGGEALVKSVIKRFLNFFEMNIPKITNVYGLTECCVDSTSLEISEKNIESFDTIPIGKPMPNQQIYIVNRENKLQPIGVVGELCIAGDSVARGYLNNPELTAERFRRTVIGQSSLVISSLKSSKITDDQCPMTNYRMYRTGDLGRWQKDGNIEFSGRIDQQVKVRGYRIELEEIENHLLKHREIKNAVVLAREDSDGDNYLCAYIVPLVTISAENLSSVQIIPVNKRILKIEELKEFLSGQLPDYLIPSRFVQLNQIPLTPNGKVNRKVLPEPEVWEGDECQAPRDNLEEKMVDIWCEVLKVEREKIGIDASFFELGGYSLKATIMASRIHKELHVKLPLVEIFNTPTIRGLAEYIKGNAKDEYVSIEPVEKKEYYALSSAQKRLYILQQMGFENTAYNMPLTISLVGGFHLEKLEKAFIGLITRHESLRTSFVTVNENEEPVQRVHKPEELEFSIDYYKTVEEEVEEIIENFIKVFNLSQAPLLRVGLIHHHTPRSAPSSQEGNSKDEYILVVDMHHIVSDGVSHDILKKDFMAFYQGEELPPLRIRYKDFCQWQNSEKEKESMKKQEAYWLGEFSGEIPVLNLPTDFLRPAVHGFEGEEMSFEIAGEESAALYKTASEEGGTLFMVLLAVTTIFLAKISGQDDIVIGSPIAGRRHADLEPIIGMFVNILALRNYPAGEKTFVEFFSELKARTLKAFENQDYQFEDLVDNVLAHRDTGRNPLFDVVFALANIDDDTGMQKPAKERLNVKQRSGDGSLFRKSKFDLSLHSGESGDRLSFVFEYSTNLFKKETIERFIIYFKRIVSLIVKKPGLKLGQLEIICEEEKRQVLYDFNVRKTNYPKDETIHHLFERQVEKRPDGVAVIGGKKKEGQITYGELNKKSDQFACLLREKGVKSDTIVGIIVERSLEMIIGILAILKVGGAYLPIDPAYPRERIDYMLKDSRAEILLTHLTSSTLSLSPGFPASPFPGFLASQPTDLAYVIYTSGTTGKPKGVLIEHRNVVSLMFHDGFPFDFSDEDTWTMFHSYCFDFSVWEMYGALLYGGKLILISEAAARDPQGFLEILKSEKVTVLNQTPAAFYNLARQELENPGKKLRLRYVIFGGEALKPAKLKPWKEKYPETKLINMFGITETTVHVTYKKLGDKEIDSNMCNVGRPIPTLSSYVMDKHLNLQPLGVAGELSVGGEGVGRGYLNRAELTKEKFIDNPYQRGEWLYKSGDLVRLTSEGELEYLGRIDQQVKIRGFRIELGEIENQLLKFAPVKEAVVIDSEDASGHKRLAAYIVPDVEYAYPVHQWLKLESQGVSRYYQSYELPNGMMLYYINRNETDFMYREIFEEQSYLKHGIRLKEGACIVDVGANIGVFSLFAHFICPGAKIYSFEPLPPIYELLKLNTSLYGINAKLFNCGLLSEAGETLFTYYPHNTVLSGCFADVEEEMDTVKAFIANQQLLMEEEEQASADQAEELLEDRLSGSQFKCKLRTLSQVIGEEGIERIDLLKIDVEKSEIEVLGGINDEDWGRIGQVAMEVHNVDSRLGKITGLLERHGFKVSTEQDRVLENTDLYNVYAVRPGDEDAEVDASNNDRLVSGVDSGRYWSSPGRLKSDARGFLKARLPDYMVPSSFVLLEEIPLTSNDKVDKKSLRGVEIKGKDDHYTGPHNEIEKKLTEIWSEILGIEKNTISTDSNFFEIGGHSLNATMMAARVHKKMNVKLSLAEVFKTPTIIELARYIQEAAKDKFISIEPAEEKEYYPLSSAQKRLYILQQMDPDTTAYNVPLMAPLSPGVNVDENKMEQAIYRLINRHESFRTSIEIIDEEPVQRIHEMHRIDFPIEYYHLQNNDGGGEPDTDVMRTIFKKFVRPFYLSQAPIVRVGMITTGEGRYILMVDMHHVISDLVSGYIMQRDFMLLLMEEELPALRIQYKDYVEWQNSDEINKSVKRQEKYWLKEYNRAGIPLLNLPIDYERSGEIRFEGSSISITIDETLTSKLKKHAGELNVRLIMFLLSVYKTLLSRYAGQEEIIVGTVVAGRQHADLDKVIGFFVNMLAIKTSPCKNKTFSEFLLEVKEKVLKSYENQEYQFEELVSKLGIQRQPGRHPLVDAVFVFQDDYNRVEASQPGPPGEKNPGLEWFNVSHFDLMLHATDWGDSIGIIFEYSINLFKQSTIEEFANFYLDILEQVVENSSIRLKDIKIRLNLSVSTSGIIQEEKDEWEL